MRTTAFAVGILLLATLAVGCAGDRQQQASADADGSYTAPASIYSVMDPTSLVYTDVAAAQPETITPGAGPVFSCTLSGSRWITV